MIVKFVVFAAIVFSAFALASDAKDEPKNREILVSAAISLKNAFEEIGRVYEKQTRIRVRFNLGASGASETD